MEIYFICVLVAFVMIYLTKAPLAMAMSKEGGYDNKHPRQQQAQLTGWGARANAAHQNAFETFAPFAAAVFVAHLGNAPKDMVNILAITFVISRIFYTTFYLTNKDKFRSLTWMIGFGATFALFILPMCK